MRLPVNQPRALGLIALAATAGVFGAAATPLLARTEAADPAPATGPAADYPMVLGAPYTVDGTTYTPADTMNIDQVGYAALEADAGAGVTIAHRTLPLPSYVEVTSLKTGRTILARVERRGPMSGPNFIGLSPAAAAQLGADGRIPVRVRRVNPPEMERALLRSGQTAPVRIDTPMSLVGVLLRKLDPTLAPPPPPMPTPTATPTTPAIAAQMPLLPQPKPPVAPAKAGAHPEPSAKRALTGATKPAAKPTEPKREPQPKPAAGKPSPGKVVVQVGAFSTRERAETAARQVGGTVSPAGKLYRVRITGFAAPVEASAALAKAKAAGYSDARIQRAD